MFVRDHPAGHTEGGDIPAVPTDHRDLPEAVQDHAVEDLAHETDVGLGIEGDRACVVRVMRRYPVVHGWQHEGAHTMLVPDPLGRRPGDLLSDPAVHVEGDSGPVLLCGATGQDHEGTGLRELRDLLPGMVGPEHTHRIRHCEFLLSLRRSALMRRAMQPGHFGDPTEAWRLRRKWFQHGNDGRNVIRASHLEGGKDQLIGDLPSGALTVE